MRKVLLGGLVLLVLLVMLLLYNLFQPMPPLRQSFLPFSEMLAEAHAGHLREVVLQGREVRGALTSGPIFRTTLPDDQDLAQRLSDQGVRVTALPAEEDATALRLVISILPSAAFLIALAVLVNRVVRALRRVEAVLDRSGDMRNAPVHDR